jgi:hypothetical protein
MFTAARENTKNEFCRHSLLLVLAYALWVWLVLAVLRSKSSERIVKFLVHSLAAVRTDGIEKTDRALYLPTQN